MYNQTPAPQANLVTEKLIEQMNILSDASQMDKTALANLTSANAALSTSNATLTQKLDEALSELRRLTQQVWDLKDSQDKKKKKAEPAWIHYCWSHGRTN